MNGTITIDDSQTAASTVAVEHALSQGTFFWLDLDAGGAGSTQGGTDHSISDLLEHTFKFHPLALEDAREFGQRPKLDEYDDVAYLVVHGAQAESNSTTEVHLLFSPRYVVSIHRGACAVLDDVRGRIGHHHVTTATGPEIVIVYLIVDALTDSFFPVLSAFDDRIDELEDAILKLPTDEQLGELFSMKRSLMTMRKVITPQRDMFAGLASGISNIPGMTDESSRYFRDLYDHLIRISDLVDSYRDLLSGVMDTHLSTVSNRLNLVMKQLAVIATVFLPLSYLTGFFGQNFLWLTGHIQSTWTFFALGVGSEIVAVVLLFALFKRRGWLGGSTA